MRALVAGQPQTLAEVTYAVENARGTMPGTVGRVDSAFDALDLLDGSEIVLFLEVSGIDDPQLSQIRMLMMKGATVVVLSKEISAELRVAAIKAGAREVLFAPWSPDRVQKCLAGAVAQTGNIEIGIQADYRSILLVEGKDQVEARVRTVSTTGLTVDTGGVRIGRDAVMRVAIQVPPPLRLPVFFARCVADNGSGAVTLRFLGQTVEEEHALTQLLAAVPVATAAPPPATPSPSGLRRPSRPPGPAPAPPPDDVPDDGATRVGVAPPPSSSNAAGARAAIGRVIAELDASVLREAPAKWLGLTLPVLTDAERLSMVSGGPLSEVAVWRTRAHVIASILEASPDLSTNELPFEEWRAGLAHARGLIRKEVTLRMTDGDQGLLRETRDVQARLNAVSDRIDRLAREAGIDVVGSGTGPLEAPAGPATFERPLPPPPPTSADSGAARSASTGKGRRVRLFVLGFAVVALGAAAIALQFGNESRRSRDVGRTGVASRPVKTTSTGVRIRAIFREPERTVAVVDRTWYDNGFQATRAAAEGAAWTVAVESGIEGRVAIRDFAGRRLVEIDTSESRTEPSATPALATTSASDAALVAPTEAAPSASPAEPAPAPKKSPLPKPTPRAKKSERGPASPSR